VSIVESESFRRLESSDVPLPVRRCRPAVQEAEDSPTKKLKVEKQEVEIDFPPLEAGVVMDHMMNVYNDTVRDLRRAYRARGQKVAKQLEATEEQLDDALDHVDDLKLYARNLQGRMRVLTAERDRSMRNLETAKEQLNVSKHEIRALKRELEHRTLQYEECQKSLEDLKKSSKDTEDLLEEASQTLERCGNYASYNYTRKKLLWQIITYISAHGNLRGFELPPGWILILREQVLIRDWSLRGPGYNPPYPPHTIRARNSSAPVNPEVIVIDPLEEPPAQPPAQSSDAVLRPLNNITEEDILNVRRARELRRLNIASNAGIIAAINPRLVDRIPAEVLRDRAARYANPNLAPPSIADLYQYFGLDENGQPRQRDGHGGQSDETD
jgi:hypothetical protein